jgi:hypothetical protein
MDLTLTQQQRDALAKHPGEPVIIDDLGTQTQYVLLRADQYRRLAQLAYDDSDLTPEEMTAAAAVFLTDAEGWGAPGMESYDKTPTAP